MTHRRSPASAISCPQQQQSQQVPGHETVCWSFPKEGQKILENNPHLETRNMNTQQDDDLCFPVISLLQLALFLFSFKNVNYPTRLCWNFLLSSGIFFKVHGNLSLGLYYPMLVCRRGWCMHSDVQLEYTAKISPCVILSRFCRNIFASSVQRCYDSLPDSLVCIVSRVHLFTAS